MYDATTRLGCFILVIALVGGHALATCGGGGGGGSGGAGGNAYKTTWTTRDYKAVLSAAAAKKEGVVLYVAAATDAEESTQRKTHRFFKTKIPNDASKERLFLKSNEDLAGKLRKAHGLKWKLHYALVCDWYGNPLLSLKSSEKGKLDGKKLRATLYSMPKLCARLQKKLKGKLAPAGKDVERGNYASAAKRLNAILVYAGYPECEQANALMARILKAGQAELDAALALEERARNRALRALARKYKGTAIEEKCASARGAKTSQSAWGEEPLAREAWDEVFAGRDWSVPSVAERVQDALSEGLAFERAGRYEAARARYALAVQLDARDPVPLVHLAEVDRHHLGDWTAAEQAFRRVVALDNDDHAVAIALHGLGKMTIWRGDNATGLKLFAQSIARDPTSLCYRNLAVYWNTEGAPKKALAFAEKAFNLDPQDAYNQVFFSVYLLLNGREAEAGRLIRGAVFDPSMSYNYACYYAVQGKPELVLKYLRRHFQEYETTDGVRAFEMAEARMDGFFKRWYDDPEFKRITALAGKTPWLRDAR